MTLKQVSGIATVTAGTPVVLGSLIIDNKGIWLHAPEGNSGVIYIGNDGNDSVSSLTGFYMNAGDTILLDNVYDLSTIYVDGSSSSDLVSWLLVGTTRSK
jgi:hypothetical protein